ncbi:hypothetical protein [Segeticoccus rhizosphaerae]|uniref:hypothetical protein n=1 Tax=Segeticoccus rhizosphaerae TaxID=1104777 RepID=UPI0012647ED7|nr:hypothetical protein [Segeticoccus rhizosphaerae]
MSRLGLRGAAMILCAYIWTLVGVATILGAAATPPGTFHTALPMPVRAALWLAPAAAAVGLAWSREHDWIALGLLVLGPMLRITSYLTAWLLYLTGHEGLSTGWYSAAIHVALLGLVALTAAIHRPATPGHTGE